MKFQRQKFQKHTWTKFLQPWEKVQEHTWSTTFQEHLFPEIQKQFTRKKSQDHTWTKFHKLAMSSKNFAWKITMDKIEGNNFVTIRDRIKGIRMELLRVAIDIVEIKGV